MSKKKQKILIEKEVEFFNDKISIKKLTLEKSNFYNEIIKYCKGREITHVQINGFKLSKNSILIKKSKKVKREAITGNLFEFVDIKLKYQNKG